jgi:hypothetical protein
MPANLRKFVMSSDRWHGFETQIDINNTTSLNDIVNEVKVHLKNTLTRSNFVDQLHELQHKDKKIHIHGVTLDEIRNSSSNQIFFVCDHCS